MAVLVFKAEVGRVWVMGMSTLHSSKARASSRPTLQRWFWLVCALWLGMLEETVRVTNRMKGSGREAAKTGPRKTVCKRRAEGHTQKDAEQLLWVREMLSPIPALTWGCQGASTRLTMPHLGQGAYSLAA